MKVIKYLDFLESEQVLLDLLDELNGDWFMPNVSVRVSEEFKEWLWYEVLTAKKKWFDLGRINKMPSESDFCAKILENYAKNK